HAELTRRHSAYNLIRPSPRPSGAPRALCAPASLAVTIRRLFRYAFSNGKSFRARGAVVPEIHAIAAKFIRKAKKRLTRPLIRVTLDMDLGRPKNLPTRSEGFGMSHRTAPGTRWSRHDGLFYKSLLFAFSLVVFVAAAGFGAHAQTIEVHHQLGTAAVPVHPQRVVVFDFGVLDSLDLLGIDVVGLPKSNIPAYLAKYGDDKYVNVGTLKEPDYEAVNALKPDLIIISSRTAAHYDELAKLAPTIYIGPDFADYLGSVKKDMRTLGRIFGVEDQVEAELAKIDAAVARVRSLSQGKSALILLITGGRASAYGPGSRYGFIHDEFGVTPVDDTIVSSTHGQSISWEYVVGRDPDYLFVIDRDAVVAGGAGQTARQVVENELVMLTRAYRNGHIVYLEPSYWYLSGGGLQ